MPTRGYTYVYINGTNFGPIRNGLGLPNANYGGSSQAKYKTSCEKTISHRQMKCKVVEYNPPDDGTNERTNLNWAITVATQTSPSTAGLASYGNKTAYAKPRIFGIFNNTALKTSGDTEIIFRGQNIGPKDKVVVVKAVNYGPSSNLFHYNTAVGKCSVDHEVMKCPMSESALGIKRTGLLFDINIDGYNTTNIDSYALVKDYVGVANVTLQAFGVCDIPIHNPDLCKEAYNKAYNNIEDVPQYFWVTKGV